MSIEWKLRRAARRPLVVVGRWRYRDHPELARNMLESVSYRRSLRRFMIATLEDPDLRSRYPLTPASVVTDFGAYRGEWAEEIAERYGCTVHAFEPVGRYHGRAVNRTARFETVSCWWTGVAAADGSATFSLLGPGAREAASAESGPTVTVRLRDVAALLPEVGVDHISLCKLNIEGGEYDVLDRMYETGWFDRVDHFQIQFHDHHPDAFRRRRLIRRRLRESHELEWDYPWVFESWARRT